MAVTGTSAAQVEVWAAPQDAGLSLRPLARTDSACSASPAPLLPVGQRRSIEPMALHIPISSASIPLPHRAALSSCAHMRTSRFRYTCTGADRASPAMCNTTCRFPLPVMAERTSRALLWRYFTHLFPTDPPRSTFHPVFQTPG